MTTRLMGDESGLWEIRTASRAQYRLDLDRRTLSRRTAEPADRAELPAVALRRDGEVLPLLGLLRPVTIGASMVALVDLRGDGVPTVRETTPVRSIDRLATRTAGGTATTAPAASDADAAGSHPSAPVGGQRGDVPVPSWVRDGVTPGVLDLRVLDQAHVWVTRDGTLVPVAQMSTEHLRAVIEILTARAGEFALGGLMATLFEVVAADLAGEVSGERLVWELTGAPPVPQTPGAWMESRALVRALRRELATRDRT
jgi:hypothetical protein